MVAQAAIQARARDGRVQELVRRSQKIIQWKQQHTAQSDYDRFLRARQRRCQLMRGVRAILEAGPPLAAIDGVERHPVSHRKHGRRFVTGRNLRQDRRGCRSVLVQ